jgi:putative peptidoglycan lipid II flippase
VNAAAPILLNATLIAALLFFHDELPLMTARNQAIAVTVSGALQLLWLWYACRRAGVTLRLKLPRLGPDVKRLMALIGPAAAGAGAVQINLVVSTALAARLLPSGSVSYIYAADRLNQLPLGLIGIGLGTVLLPTISRLLGRGEDAAAMTTQNRGMELALLLTLPATVALVVCGAPIAAALFQHGKFDATDTHFTAQALAAFSIGLPSYILVKVLTPGYYARSDTKTPVRYATISMGVNLALNLALIVPLQHMGPPLATAIASTVNVALLYRTLVKRGQFVVDAQLKRRAPRLLAAALAMGAVMYFLNDLFQPYTTGASLIRWAAMAVLVGTGALVYAAAVFATGYTLSTRRLAGIDDGVSTLFIGGLVATLLLSGLVQEALAALRPPLRQGGAAAQQALQLQPPPRLHPHPQPRGLSCTLTSPLRLLQRRRRARTRRRRRRTTRRTRTRRSRARGRGQRMGIQREPLVRIPMRIPPC